MVGNFSHVDAELDRRYEGDASKLQMLLYSGSYTKDDLILGIDAILENGCFCPTCLYNELEMLENA